MIRELKNLSRDEMEALIKAPLLVSILIAGADGKIDRNEINSAMESSLEKARRSNALRAFYENVSEDFEDKLKVIIQSYSSSADKRGKKIAEELTALNPILSKIDGKLAKEIYDSLLQMALGIAKSSGGIFGLKSIGEEEARYLNLSMIQPPSGS